MSGQGDAGQTLWSYLAEAPLLWLALTLGAFVLSDGLARLAGRAPWANSVLMSVVLVALVLGGTGTDYATYFEGAQFVHFLLGPATVALALPLWDNRRLIRRSIVPMAAALLAGSLTAILSALGLAWLFGVRGAALLSLAPKSTTAPVALGIAEELGGIPSLTAVLVILTGVIGAMVAIPLLDRVGLRDWRARGLAIGIAAHGIGTAHAFTVHPVAGAFSGIGMGLNAILTAILAPLVVGWLL